MSLKLNLTLCIIFALWTSVVSGKILTLSGYDWHAKIEKCRAGGSDSHYDQFKIDRQSLGNVSYDDFSDDSIVILHGTFGMTLALTPYLNDHHAVLDHYKKNEDGSKNYSTSWLINDNRGRYRNEIKLSFTVQPNGDVLIDQYVQAATWVLVFCSESTSRITGLKIGV